MRLKLIPDDPSGGVGELGSPQLGPFGGVIGATKGLMFFHHTNA
jgi:hypothetical protein